MRFKANLGYDIMLNFLLLLLITMCAIVSFCFMTAAVFCEFVSFFCGFVSFLFAVLAFYF